MEGGDNFIEEGDDLFEVQDLLNQQPKSKTTDNIKKIIEDQTNVLKLDGQFSIIKGYGNDQRAKLFSVGNPHKPEK